MISVLTKWRKTIAKDCPGIDCIVAKYCDLNMHYLMRYYILYDCRFHSDDKRPSHVLLLGNDIFYSRIQLITYFVCEHMEGYYLVFHFEYNTIKYNTTNTIQYNTIQYNAILYIQYNKYNTIQYNTIQQIQYKTTQYNKIK